MYQLLSQRRFPQKILLRRMPRISPLSLDPMMIFRIIQSHEGDPGAAGAKMPRNLLQEGRQSILFSTDTHTHAPHAHTHTHTCVLQTHGATLLEYN